MGQVPNLPSRPSLRSWLVPDLALVAALAALLCLFAGPEGGTALFRDSDAGWHIQNGEQIVASRVLPHADAFSFSKPAAPWIAWEWAADALTGAIHRVSGLDGVATLYGLAIAASVWMWFRLTWAVEGNFLFACLLAAPMISTTAIHWLARPHIWSWLFALASVWWCERAPQRLNWRHFAGIALVSALWANLHGSFLLGPSIALIYAMGSFLRRAVWIGQAGKRPYLASALTSLLATLANPYGWHLHQHVIAYLSDSALLARVGEFQSFNFQAPGAIQPMIVLTAALAGGFAAIAVRRPERFLLTLLITAAAIRSARALPLAALLLLPLANGSFTEVLTLARSLKPKLRRRLDDTLRYGERLRVLDGGFRGYALIPAIAAVLLAGLHARAAFPAARFPVTASEAVAALPQNVRVFAPDYFGGYLIYRFRGQRKVFFDGRSDFYGADFVDRYARIVEARPGWREEFARWRFTHALLPPDSPLLDALKSSGWRELHRDRTALLLAKDAQ